MTSFVDYPTPGAHRITAAELNGAFAALAPVTISTGVPGWLEAIIGATETDTECVFRSPRGAAAAVFASRSSDSTLTGSQGGFTVGLFPINDNATQKQTMYGTYIEPRRYPGAGTTQGIEVGLINRGDNPGIHPFAMGAPGSTLAFWASSGRNDVLDGTDATAAFGIINAHTKWGAGIVFGANSLVIGGGTGQAIEFGPQHAMLWFSPDGTANSLIRGDATVSGSGGLVQQLFTNGGMDIIARNGITAISVANNLNVLQATKIAGSLEVTGPVNFDSVEVVTGSITSNGGLNVTGTATINGRINAAGMQSFANDAAAGAAGLVSKDLYFNSTLGAVTWKA